MQFIYSMPFWSCPPNPAFLSQDAIIALSVAAEEAGFAAVSFTEHPIPDESWRITGGHDGLDPFIGLAIAAAVTKKLRLLTYLCVLPYRNPFLLAKTVATLDVLSGGRLILGAGVGYQEAEYAALGVDYAERNALFDEALEANLEARGRKYGLILDIGGYYKNVITLAPSLDISYEEMDLALELLDQLLIRVTRR